MNIAVFDLDGTLIRDNIGTTFVKFLSENGRIPFARKIYIYTLYILYKLQMLDFAVPIKLGYIAFTGMSVDLVAQLAQKCFEEKIVDNIYNAGIAEIRELKSKGFEIILATGAHESISLIFADHIGAQRCICTKSVIKDGKYTSEGIMPLPYKEGKRDLVRQLLLEVYGDKAIEITVYTDEKKDLPLLDLATHCVAVNADADILRAVEERGGSVREFS